MANTVQKIEPTTVTAINDGNATTPMTLLHQAVASGNIELAEKLMGLQERWEKTQARKAFDEAISEAKAEIPLVLKNRKGHNATKYADFAAIAATVDPIISKHGLSYRFRTTQTDTRINVTCVLSHKAGHSEETTLSGQADVTGNKNAIQAIGSTLTYLQRYSLVQMLGIAASEDDDGAASSGGAITEDQVQELNALMLDVKADTTRFLKYLKIEKLADLPAKKFADDVSALNAKRK